VDWRVGAGVGKMVGWRGGRGRGGGEWNEVQTFPRPELLAIGAAMGERRRRL
jgi:hypothetical protein